MSTPESEDLRGCIKSSEGDGGLKKCGDMYPELAESAELAPENMIIIPKLTFAKFQRNSENLRKKNAKDG